ncbi:DNA mismatch repair protein MutS [Oscillospiraceae bacterium MB08-C2-2]|nr:DNA mismatch repair protein MutS [Oscillospiraceae bacterium MB08-C2-2]
MAELSPMMQQYFRIKDSHKDHIVFFRLGDFYEMFYEDALIASKELELVLTGRDCGQETRAPMCGIPFKSCETYIAKLIQKGYKVAICEQVEDPAFAKGVVSREVVRVITPGTVLESNLLEEDSNNFLCCIFYQPGGYGLIFADISTGEMNLIELTQDDDSLLLNELSRYAPREVIFNPAFLEKKSIAKFLREKMLCTADLLEEEKYDIDAASARILAHFEAESLEGLGLAAYLKCTRALGALLEYLADTQKLGVERMITLRFHNEAQYMNLDQNARTHLELLSTMRSKDKRGSLLWVLDKTKTPMGKRQIKNFLRQPLVNPAAINKRLNAVEELVGNQLRCSEIIDLLGGIFDIERMITRIVYGNATPREYKALEQTIRQFPGIKGHLADCRSAYLKEIDSQIDLLEDVAQLLEASIQEEPPTTLKDGGVIRKGYSDQLDQLRDLMDHALDYITRMENEQREATGIRNLKISYNKVFGYYIEVTRSNLSQVPEHYIRKQTLANCERYIIQELKELEEKILSATDQAISLETQLFEQVRTSVAKQLHRIQQSASAISRLDVFCSFAQTALMNQYVRPDVDLSQRIAITDGRHPVVEQLLTGAPFVPNDTLLEPGENQIAIITGPNMAGKSTYMRQTALIVLMAQIGSFVPAASAQIGVVDGIYTRVGASDDLSAGQSTFMVEMVEVAKILKDATANSLLILDEIGRGTSTYDGMSIAQGVLEFIADKRRLGAKTLFATHYHELTQMEERLPCVKNYNICVKKRGDDITFLRKIVRGGADESYGIEVSKLAGIPDWIIKRAKEILKQLESDKPMQESRPVKAATESMPDEMQIQFENPKLVQLEAQLKDIDLNTLTPLEALNILYGLKELVK